IGTLSSSSSTTLSIITGSVTGIGSVNQDNIVLGTAAILSFSGIITSNALTSVAANLLVTADVIVNQTITFGSGIFSIDAGGSLDVGANADIVISGGTLVLNGGTLGLAGSYNVIYNSGSAIAGLELTGSGLHNVTINVNSG